MRSSRLSSACRRPSGIPASAQRASASRAGTWRDTTDACGVRRGKVSGRRGAAVLGAPGGAWERGRRRTDGEPPPGRAAPLRLRRSPRGGPEAAAAHHELPPGPGQPLLPRLPPLPGPVGKESRRRRRPALLRQDAAGARAPGKDGGCAQTRAPAPPTHTHAGGQGLSAGGDVRGRSIPHVRQVQHRRPGEPAVREEKAPALGPRRGLRARRWAQDGTARKLCTWGHWGELRAFLPPPFPWLHRR